MCVYTLTALGKHLWNPQLPKLIKWTYFGLGLLVKKQCHISLILLQWEESMI